MTYRYLNDIRRLHCLIALSYVEDKPKYYSIENKLITIIPREGGISLITSNDPNEFLLSLIFVTTDSGMEVFKDIKSDISTVRSVRTYRLAITELGKMMLGIKNRYFDFGGGIYQRAKVYCNRYKDEEDLATRFDEIIKDIVLPMYVESNITAFSNPKKGGRIIKQKSQVLGRTSLVFDTENFNNINNDEY